MPYFTYHQNNSGGEFVFDAATGISMLVIIEANDARDANSRAEKIGLYFDGKGDCSCCGRRWDATDPWDKGFEEPTIYGGPAADYRPYSASWVDGPEVYVHTIDGEFHSP